MSEDGMPADELEGTLGKQRRNVVVVAVILIAYYLAGGGLEPALHAPMVGITFRSPERIVWLLWVALVYFMWRYWLYSRELRRSAAEVREYLYREHPKARQLMLRCFRRDNATRYTDAEGVANPGGVQVRMETLRRIRFGLRHCSYVGNLFIDPRHAQLARPMLEWDVHFQAPTWTIAWLRLVCFARAFLTKNELSDLLIPYVLVALAIIASAARAWGLLC